MARPRTPSPPLDSLVIQRAVVALRRSLSDEEILDFEAATESYEGGDCFADLVSREARLIREAREPRGTRRRVVR